MTLCNPDYTRIMNYKVNDDDIKNSRAFCQNKMSLRKSVLSQIKGQVTEKALTKKIKSFTHPHVIPDLFLTCVEHERRKSIEYSGHYFQYKIL